MTDLLRQIPNSLTRVEHMKYSPMLLTEAKDGLPEGDQWSYEAKLDGYRLVAEISKRHTSLFTRRSTDYTDRFPEVTDELHDALSGRRAIVDGEVVGYDSEGNPSFGVLRRKRPDAIFYIFDLLEVDGKSLIHKSLEYRRSKLEEIFEKQESVKRFSVFTDRDSLIESAGKLGLEGVIAKKNDSVYSPGTRSKNWLKYIINRHPEGFGRY